MTDDDMPDPRYLSAGLAGVRNARHVIAAHLSRMASAAPPYRHFKDEHLLSRMVWQEAAEMIVADGQKGGKRKP